jgi:hypothetical protein
MAWGYYDKTSTSAGTFTVYMGITFTTIQSIVVTENTSGGSAGAAYYNAVKAETVPLSNRNYFSVSIGTTEAGQYNWFAIGVV